MDTISKYDKFAVGNRVAELRRKHNISQATMAEMLDVSVTTMSGYENGKSEVPHWAIDYLCRTYNVSADYFYYGVERELEEKEVEEKTDLFKYLSRLTGMERERAMKVLRAVFE